MLRNLRIKMRRTSYVFDTRSVLWKFENFYVQKRQKTRRQERHAPWNKKPHTFKLINQHEKRAKNYWLKSLTVKPNRDLIKLIESLTIGDRTQTLLSDVRLLLIWLPWRMNLMFWLIWIARINKPISHDIWLSGGGWWRVNQCNQRWSISKQQTRQQ